MSFRDRIDDAELSAFADGQLSRRRAKAVAARLRDDPDAAERLQGYLRQDRALAEHYRSVLSEPVPERLLDLRRPPVRWPPPAVAGAVAMLLFAAVAAWQLLPEGEPVADVPDLAAVALEAFAQPGETAGAVPPPGIRPAGFQLDGKRRLVRQGRQVDEYIFRAPSGQRVALYVSDAEEIGTAAYRVVTNENEDAKAVEWREQGRQYVLVGVDAVSDLTRLAVDLRSGSVHAGATSPAPAAVSGAPGAATNGIPTGIGASSDRIAIE